MKSQIKLYRVVLNVLFYIFYVLLASLAFSFIFPTLLVVLGKSIFAPNDPIFDSIQIIILVLVLIFSLVFRRYFYLPITEKITETKKESIKKEEVKETPELDIKLGKEIK